MHTTEKPLISVIVPVYNVGPYLDPCVDSLLGQTYQHIEVLLIDDGSTDGSGAVCDGYAARDPRVRVIHQQNQGVSAARNAGLDAATGAYIAFVDADDYVALDYLEVLYQNLTKQGADIVCCNFTEVSDGKAEERFVVQNARLIRSKETLFYDYLSGKEQYGASAWAKLMDAGLLKTHRFSSLKYGEDTLFMMTLFWESPTVYLIPYHGYYYVRQQNSATQKLTAYNMEHAAGCLEYSRYMFTHLDEFGSEVKRMIVNLYAERIYMFILSLCASGDTLRQKECYDELCSEIENVLLYRGLISPDHHFPLKLWSYKHFPVLFQKLWLALHPTEICKKT